MPVYGKKSSSLSEGINAMASVVDGYIQGEATKHAREVEEREYAFRREEFDENTRQTIANHQEMIREFDARILHQKDESRLAREHAFEYQDIQNEQADEQNLAQRESSERISTGIVNQRYSHDRKVAEQNAVLNKIQFEQSVSARYERFHGEDTDIDQINDEWIVSIDGSLSSPRQVRDAGGLTTELRSISDGKGHTFLNTNVTPEMADSWLAMIHGNANGKGAGGPDAERALYESLMTPDENGIAMIATTPNTDKENQIQQLMLERSGLQTAAQMNALPTEQIAQLRSDVYGISRGHEKRKTRLLNEELAYRYEMNLLEQNILPGGAPPDALPAKEAGQSLVWSTEKGAPVSTGLVGGDTFFDDQMKQLMRAGAAYKRYGETAATDELAQKQLEQAEAQIRNLEQTMRRDIIRAGGEPREMDPLMKGVWEGGNWNPSDFALNRPLMDTAAPPRGPMETSGNINDGVRRALVNGKWQEFRPGQVGWEEAGTQSASSTAGGDQSATADALLSAAKVRESNAETLRGLEVSSRDISRKKEIDNRVSNFASEKERTSAEIEAFRSRLEVSSAQSIPQRGIGKQ